MPTQFVAFLRAIAHKPMQPFRDALTRIGCTDVRSFGMSGNLIFRSEISPEELEQQITALFSTRAFIRTRTGLARVVASDPFREQAGASVFFLTRPVPAERRRAFEEIDFDDPRPVIRGRTIYLVHPARRRGRKSSVDFEKLTGLAGTARSSRIVRQILELMRQTPLDP